jgi:hypothetical protein
MAEFKARWEAFAFERTGSPVKKEGPRVDLSSININEACAIRLRILRQIE